MTTLTQDHAGPWTEAEYLALGETSNRIELVGGGLWVTPEPDAVHRDITWGLIGAVRPAAREAGLRSWAATNLRLARGYILNPDLVVADTGRNSHVVDAADVIMVGEVTSSTTAAVDRLQKKHFYAAARIGFYLLVEPQPHDPRAATLTLHRLQGEQYFEHAVARPGETLTSFYPFPLQIGAKSLTPI